jgi:hypothetical protein
MVNKAFMRPRPLTPAPPPAPYRHPSEDCVTLLDAAWDSLPALGELAPEALAALADALEPDLP